MSGIDDLVHDLEVEAEVLRAISHLTPRQAVDFLERLTFKLHEAFLGGTKRPEPIWYKPPESAEVAPSPPHPLLAPPRNAELSPQPNKTQTMLNVIRAKGPISPEDLFRQTGELLGLDLKRAKQLLQPLLWQALHRRVEKSKDGMLTLIQGSRSSPSTSEPSSERDSEEIGSGS